MASTWIDQSQLEYQVSSKFQVTQSTCTKSDSKKLTGLSRNVLIIVCEFLSFFEITMLASSNRKILNKLDNFQENSNEVSYKKRRAIIYFQGFFFQQFPTTDIFIKRMSSITSSSTMASSSFLPLTKQSSLVLDKKYSLPQLSQQSSCNPFDVALEIKSGRDFKNLLLEKMDDQKSNNYIEETYSKWRDLYVRALKNKKEFVLRNKNEFYSAFVQDPTDYAREIFLDPSQCENPCFVLPMLTRENFSQKGLFYRTEKILVQNYYNCFQKYSVDYTKKLLWDINLDVQSQITQNQSSKIVLQELISEDLGQNSQEALLDPLQFDMDALMEDNLGIGEMDELELALQSLQGLQKTSSKTNNQFDCYDFSLSNMISPDQDISALYSDISSYTLRQFKLICYAHKCQLDFILQQIQMAPSSRQNFYIYIEDYVLKERNLRYLFRKVSQNYIIQEAFQETLLRKNIFQASQTTKHPYICDFLLLEYMDSIWINEIYRPHSENLLKILIMEVQAVHCIERFEELAEKKDILRKLINLVHQTEFNISNNADFLQISQKEAKIDWKTDNQGKNLQTYQKLVDHLHSSVRSLLKQMQRQSQSVSEYIQLCQHYEAYQFHKIQEVEYFYQNTKKYYLGKAFSNELGSKLENSKYTKQQNTQNHGYHYDGNLNQVIPQYLVDTFFHSLLRQLVKEVKFKDFMESEQLIQSLFELFHIDQVQKSHFAGEINQLLTECHSQIEDILQQHPQLAGKQPGDEELKEDEQNDTDHVLVNQCPFTLIASDEDDDFIGNMQQPDLNRGYSDQKRQYQKGLRRVIFKTFQQLEAQFDFKNLIAQQRQQERKKVMDEIQSRIEIYNQALQPYNNATMDVDEDLLPDPSSLMASFTGGNGLNLPSLQRSNNSYSFHISSSQQVNKDNPSNQL